MFKLIQNELIKIFSKISTYIMLAILLIFIGAFAFLMRSVTNNFGAASYTTEDWNNEIQYLESSKPQGYELQIEQYQFMKQLGAALSGQDWEWQAVTEVYNAYRAPVLYMEDSLSEEEKLDYEQKLEAAKERIKARDWKRYASLRLEQLRQGEESDAIKEARVYPYQYMLEHNLDPAQKNWQEDVVNTISSAKVSLLQMEEQQSQGHEVSEERRKELENGLALAQYQLDHGISSYIDEDGNTQSIYWQAFIKGAMTLTFASVIMIVIAGGCVANEFSAGTIKFLLINPVKRSKIIISKYLTLLLLAAALLVAVFGATALADIIIIGTGDVGMPHLVVTDGIVTESSSFLYTFEQYLLNGVNLVAMTTMAFMISSLLRNSAVAIGMGVAALLGGNILISILAQFEQDWGRYVLFANLDLAGILKGNTLFPNQTVTFAAITLVVYMVVFLLTAFDAFTRREV